MKPFILIACLLASANCFAQTFAKFERKMAQIQGDTVELPSDVRFIKVDGKVYEIRRTTSIEEARPGNFIQGLRYIVLDTARTARIAPFGRGIPVGLPDDFTHAY